MKVAFSGRFMQAAVVLFAGMPAVGPACQISATAGYGRPVEVCEVTDPRINEASGLAASRLNPGLYYTHNDSGGKPQVYVLNRQGTVVAAIRLLGAENVDWEDISLAPGEAAGSSDVCVADIGDNSAEREEFVLYRFPEPRLENEAGRTLDVRPRVYRCRYADGARDAEGFAVHPGSGDAYIFTKRFDGACRVYRLPAPWPAKGITTLQRIAELRFPDGALPVARMVTAADIAPDGYRLVTRSYLGGWEWRMPGGGEGRFEPIFGRSPTALELAVELQGEAICYSADGGSLLTIGERTPTRLFEMRTLPEPESAQP